MLSLWQNFENEEHTVWQYCWIADTSVMIKYPHEQLFWKQFSLLWFKQNNHTTLLSKKKVLTVYVLLFQLLQHCLFNWRFSFVGPAVHNPVGRGMTHRLRTAKHRWLNFLWHLMSFLKCSWYLSTRSLNGPSSFFVFTKYSEICSCPAFFTTQQR